MGFPWARVKTWVSLETLVYSDLNAEFDNILQNNTPANINDYSASVGQMQTQTSPGGVGTESLATSLAGEIERIRYQLAQILGTTYWYDKAAVSLAQASSSLVLAADRILSGRVRGTLSSGFKSQQPIYLTPNGASGIKLKGASTNLSLYIGGTQYTVSSDLTAGPLSAAPAANNTCLVNLSGLAADKYSAMLGEKVGDILNYTGNLSNANLYAYALPIKTVGSNISALAGKWAAFKVVDGANTEYFIGKVEAMGIGPTYYISYCYRGFFFDSSDAPIQRTVLTDGDTITLMNLTYCFVKFTAGTPSLDVTYNQPVYSSAQPSSPATGDFWFDLTNLTWKKYNGVSYDTIIAAYVGMCFQDSASSTLGARSADFYKVHSRDNTISPYYFSGSSITGTSIGESIVVNGKRMIFQGGVASWDFTAGKDTSDGAFTPSGSDGCFLYISEDGAFIHSNIAPYNRSTDLQGWYHPHNPWRCVGLSNYASGTTFGAITYKFLNKEFYNGLRFVSQAIVSAFTTTGTATPVTNATITYRATSQNSRHALLGTSNAYIALLGSATGARELEAIFRLDATGPSGVIYAGSNNGRFTSVAASSGDVHEIPCSAFSAELQIERLGYINTATLQLSAVSANTTAKANGFYLCVQISGEG